MPTIIERFEAKLSPELRTMFRSLDEPVVIQAYLDAVPYIAEERDRSPLDVIRDRQCHCLDGGFFAALALWRLGFKPLLLDLTTDPGADDDHVLALFQVDGCWGAIAKSNYAGLRYREPVHRSLRELVMTYFDPFFSKFGDRTLRGYTLPFDLSRYPDTGWAWDEASTQVLYRRFYARKSIRIISAEAASRLHPVDKRTYDSGTLGTNMDEVYPRAH